jgi:hypothetical protein
VLSTFRLKSLRISLNRFRKAGKSSNLSSSSGHFASSSSTGSSSSSSSAWISLIIDAPQLDISLSRLIKLTEQRSEQKHHQPKPSSLGGDESTTLTPKSSLSRKPSVSSSIHLHPHGFNQQQQTFPHTHPNQSSTHQHQLQQQQQDPLAKLTEQAAKVLDGLEKYTRSVSKILRHGVGRLLLRKVDIQILNFEVKLVDDIVDQSSVSDQNRGNGESVVGGAKIGGTAPDVDLLLFRVGHVLLQVRTPGVDEDPAESNVRPYTASTSTGNNGGVGAAGVNSGGGGLGVPPSNAGSQRSSVHSIHPHGHSYSQHSHHHPHNRTFGLFHNNLSAGASGKFAAILSVSNVEAYGRVLAIGDLRHNTKKDGIEIERPTNWELLMSSKQASTVRVSHDGTIVFGRLADLSGDVELAGFKLYLSNVMRLSPKLLNAVPVSPSSAKQSSTTSTSPTSFISSSSTFGGPGPISLEIPQTLRVPSSTTLHAPRISDTVRHRTAKQDQTRWIHSLIEISQQFSQLMPSASFRLLDVTLFIDTHHIRESVSEKFGVDLLDIALEARLEHMEAMVSLTQKTNYTGTQTGWLDGHFFVKNLSVNATYPYTNEKGYRPSSVVHLVTLPSSDLRVKTSLPSLPSDVRHMHMTLKDLERGQFSFDWAIESLGIGVDDKLLKAGLELADALKQGNQKVSSYTPPKGKPPVNFDHVAKHVSLILDLITINHIQLRMYTPSVYMMFTNYKPSVMDEGNAVFVFGIEDIDVLLCEEIFVAKLERQFSATKIMESNSPISYNFKVEVLVCIFTSTFVKKFLLTSVSTTFQVHTVSFDSILLKNSFSGSSNWNENSKDRLIEIDSFTAVSRIEVPYDKSPTGQMSSLKFISVRLDSHIDTISVDFCPLVKSHAMDYFALALALSALISSLPPKSKIQTPTHVPVAPGSPVKSLSAISILPLHVDTFPTPKWEFIFSLVAELQIGLIRVTASELLQSGICLTIQNIQGRGCIGQTSIVDGKVVPKEPSIDSYASGRDTGVCAGSSAPSVTLSIGSVGFRTFNDFGLASANNEYGETMLELSQLKLTARVGDEAELEIEDTIIGFNFRRFYISLESSLHLIKLAKILKADSSETPVEFGGICKDPKKLINICLRKVHFEGDFPTGSQLHITANPINVSVTDQKSAQISIPLVEFVTFGDCGEELKISSLISTSAEFSKQGSQLTVKVRMKRWDVVNPHGFEFNGLFDDFINTQKAMKNTCFQKLGLRPSVDFDLGQTKMSSFSFPNIEVFIGEASLQIDDDPFECALSRNYKVALQEQQGRIARDKAFFKKAGSIRAKARTAGPKDMKDIENAWWLLQEFNSRSWIQKVNELKAQEEGCKHPPLFRIALSNVNFRVSLPTLPAETLEESLHIIDPTTPADTIYNDIVPLFLSIALEELVVQIRDFPLPLLHIPKSGTRSWKSEGILIIADPSPAKEAERVVKLPLDPLPVEPVTVIRIVNAPKIYTRTRTVITTSSTIFLTWGAAIEPPLADIIRILDTFTKATVDMSPPVGWWDKMRLMLHGQNLVTVTGGGAIRMRVLGSITPYFDPSKHFGTDGIEISISKGIRLDVGGEYKDAETVVIECGKLEFSLPNSEYEIKKAQELKENRIRQHILAQFSGGVRIGIGVRFMTWVAEESCEAPQTKNHCDVTLRIPEYGYNKQTNMVSVVRMHGTI